MNGFSINTQLTRDQINSIMWMYMDQTFQHLLKKQWAAETTQQEETSVPAQKMSLLMYMAAIQGCVPGREAVPPRMRPLGGTSLFLCLVPQTGFLAGVGGLVFRGPGSLLKPIILWDEYAAEMMGERREKGLFERYFGWLVSIETSSSIQFKFYWRTTTKMSTGAKLYSTPNNNYPVFSYKTEGDNNYYTSSYHFRLHE